MRKQGKGKEDDGDREKESCLQKEELGHRSKYKNRLLQVKTN